MKEMPGILENLYQFIDQMWKDYKRIIFMNEPKKKSHDFE